MKRSLLSKAFRVLTTRPALFFENLRGYFLFRWARLWASLTYGPRSGVRLGRNVRVQKLHCLSAERPQAMIEVGDHSVIYERAELRAFGAGKLSLGERAVVGDVRIYARKQIRIGRRAVFSWNVFIQDFQPHPLDPQQRAQQLEVMTDHFSPTFDGHNPSAAAFDWEFPTDPVVIGDDVWFGANSTVLPGVTIGSGSIVAAGAVVVRGTYPPGSVLAGNPARVVKTVGASPSVIET